MSVPDGKSQATLVQDMETHASDPILNQATVAAVFGVHKSTVMRWLESGAIKSERNPKGILKVRRSVILNFFRSAKWGENEEMKRQLSKIEEIEDGDKTLVGDSGGSEASLDDHNRRNRRSK